MDKQKNINHDLRSLVVTLGLGTIGRASGVLIVFYFLVKALAIESVNSVISSLIFSLMICALFCMYTMR